MLLDPRTRTLLRTQTPARLVAAALDRRALVADRSRRILRVFGSLRRWMPASRSDGSMRSLALCAALVGTVLSLCGCTGLGLLGDGSSVAGGSFHYGYLRRGKRLPEKGAGYVIPELWRVRGNNFATDEMVSAIQRVARRVAKEHPGGILGVADLSQPGGGESKMKLHRSHQNGHDADLIWYAVDEDGKPVEPTDCMPTYGASLWAQPPRPSTKVTFGPFSPRRFDIKRNWALVRALLEDPDIEVQYLFIHNRLRSLLLEHARNRGESDELIDRAEALLRQPGDSLPHDDHLHLRIYCSPSDRALGCRDGGPLRWWKKRYKYMPPHSPEQQPRIARVTQTRRVSTPAISLPPPPPPALGELAEPAASDEAQLAQPEN